MEESGREFNARTVYGQTHSTLLRSAQCDKGVAASDGNGQSAGGLL